MSAGRSEERAQTTVHVVLPGDIDDPAEPSGGNVYDRRVLRGLATLGWTVREHPVPGDWPDPSPAERAALAGILATLPDGALVLVDGLVASAVPELLVPAAGRLRLVVLLHMPLGTTGERAVLDAARAVIATSPWTRDRLAGVDRLHVATPGVDPVPVAPGTPDGRQLLCVAAVTPGKGHDLLAAALAGLDVSCVCVGSLTRDPGFVARLPTGRPGGLRLVGPLVGDALQAAYAAADLLVLPSREETYGMVVTEALARGIPVLATAVGGVPETLGRAPDGTVPGLLVEPPELAGALRRWLADAALRDRLRDAARARREMLTGWEVTAQRVAAVLAAVD